MLRLSPFAAVRPLPNMAARVASAPYDVVDADEAWATVRANPLSFLRITRSEADLPPEVDPYSAEVYEKAAENFRQFIADGVLERDAENRLYVYRQVRNGRRQISVVGCCHIDDYNSGLIRRHELTRADKEADRTRHIDTLNAQAEPVFLTYRDEPEIDVLMRRDMNDRPLFHFVDPTEVTHTVWRVADPAPYVHAFSAVPRAYIADGHHRVASAASVSKLRRSKHGATEADWFLAALFPMSQLCILPYHRLVKSLGGPSPRLVIDLLGALGNLTPSPHGEPAAPGEFGIYLAGEWHVLRLHPSHIDISDPVGSLDAAILQRLILDPIFGVRDPRTDPNLAFLGGVHPIEELKRRVDSGDAAMAIAMYATSMDQLLAVSDANLIMPPKSTWFEPKLRSGLWVHELG